MLLLTIGGWFVRFLAQTLREIEAAETRLQAVRVVCDIIRAHAKCHTPEWPRSWDDLKAWSREDSTDPYANWTMDASLESDVVIDFKATIDQVRSSADAEATTIRPAPGGGNYHCEYLVSGLLQALRDQAGSPSPGSSAPSGGKDP